MRLNPFRKRRTVKGFAPPKKSYKNPLFKKENFSDILFRKLKIHYGFIILILFGFAYLFFYSEIFQINMIEVKGAEKITRQEIERHVREKMDSSRFLIFSQRNYFFFDDQSAEAEIKETLSGSYALEKFTLQKSFPRKVFISLKEVTPSITWLTGGSYYYLDKNGIVALSLPEEEVNKEFPLIEDTNNLSVKLQEEVISPKILASIPKLKILLNEINLEIDRFFTPEVFCLPEDIIKPEESDSNKNSNSNENTNTEPLAEETKNSDVRASLNVNGQEEECDIKSRLKNNSEIHVGIKDSFKILYDTAEDIKKQTENLDLMLRTKLKGKANLEYIDLRFDNRVYYK